MSMDVAMDEVLALPARELRVLAGQLLDKAYELEVAERSAPAA